MFGLRTIVLHVAFMATVLAADVHQEAVAASVAKAADLVQRMTLEEKLDYIGGYDRFFIRGIARLGIPAIKMSDGPMGARNDGPTTCYGGGVALAASWDVDLARRIGAAMARDCRARGVHILLAPGVNISRSPLCGRNFEYLGEDPFLVGTMACQFIRGVQSGGVLATIKHFAANNQERDRNKFSSEVDERTLQEIYFPAFRMAVQDAQVGCLMTSYNPLNGVHCSQNAWLIDRVLRQDWGFAGIVMSDWEAVHDTRLAVHSGLDLEMPSGKHLNQKTLLPMLKDGSLDVATIDRKVGHILSVIIAAGFLERPQLDASIPVDDPVNAAVALDGARAAIVLAKNDNHLLPFDPAAIKRVLVVGPNAHPAVACGAGSGFTTPFHAVSILDGLKARLPTADIVHHVGIQKKGKPEQTTGREEVIAAAKAADLVVVCVGYGQATDANSLAKPYKADWPDGSVRRLDLIETEASDRSFALHPLQVETIRAVCEANRRVVVVLNTGAGVDPAGWADQTPAILCAWYPGQAVGTAVVEILTGAINPSGKLPLTFAKQYDDYPSAPFYGKNEQNKTVYGEGVNVGYRGFDAKHLTPWLCFGHGLSYTSFDYRTVTATAAADGTVDVRFSVRNSGARAGSEIAQVYVTPTATPVSRPPQELKGFAKIHLAPGETGQVTVTLRSDAFAYWNPERKTWVTEPGSYGILVGASSRDIRLTTSIRR